MIFLFIFILQVKCLCTRCSHVVSLERKACDNDNTLASYAMNQNPNVTTEDTTKIEQLSLSGKMRKATFRNHRVQIIFHREFAQKHRKLLTLCRRDEKNLAERRSGINLFILICVLL